MTSSNVTGLRNIAAATLLAALAGNAAAQLRVAAWNISNYGGGRDVPLATSFYTTFSGRSMDPDAVMALEMTSQTGVDSLRNILNTSGAAAGAFVGTPWATPPFTNGPDTDATVVYRTDRLVYLGRSLIISGGNINGAPRDVYRYDFRLVGYTGPAAEISMYPVHMKSGDTSTDQNRRQVEALAIRNDMNALATSNPARTFMVGGDFNIQSSSQTAYQTLVAGAATGRVNDPIATPGSWNNNIAFRIVHTQDPSGAGGMDDRHDQILISSNLINNVGMDYIGNPSIPYSTSTWNDPNHSYRAWGNDGTSYNTTLTVAGNTFVGPTIAQALIDCAVGGGHLPVILDVRVPATAAVVPSSFNFGNLRVGQVADTLVSVTNAADVLRWSVAGIADLNYTLSVTGPGFVVPIGSYSEPADPVPADPISHTIAVDTSTPGLKSATLTFTTDAPDQPVITVPISAAVYCTADFNRDFEVDLADFFLFLNAFDETDPSADINGDFTVDLGDFFEYLNAFDENC